VFRSPSRSLPGGAGRTNSPGAKTVGGQQTSITGHERGCRRGTITADLRQASGDDFPRDGPPGSCTVGRSGEVDPFRARRLRGHIVRSWGAYGGRRPQTPPAVVAGMCFAGAYPASVNFAPRATSMFEDRALGRRWFRWRWPGAEGNSQGGETYRRNRVRVVWHGTNPEAFLGGRKKRR